MLPSLLLLAALAPGASAVQWTTHVDRGLERAAETASVVLLSLGSATEARSETFARDVYKAKSSRAYLERSVNLAAWTWPGDDVALLPDFDGYEPLHHATNLATFKERWLRPNDQGVVAQPQHVWLSSKGEVLVSCPFEMDALEFAWCFDEALRRAGVDGRPALPKGAHPPRRLLLGEVFRLANTDEHGRGFWPQELELMLDEFQKRNLTMSDAADVRRILFTDDPDAVEAMTRELGKWDLASAMMPNLKGILDGTVYLLGLNSSARFLPALEQFVRHPRASLRSQVAAAYEQIGDSAGLATVKQALKKEKDDDVRERWVRALGACGRGNASTAKELVKFAEKDKVESVRVAAIFALGYVLPEPKALEFLLATLRTGEGAARRAALLALGLGRATTAREEVAVWTAESVDPETRETAEAVLAVLDGGNLYGLRDAADRVVPDEIDRSRVFFPSGF
ncbi:MAG: hypothetical protein H6831_15985 [Planctomycetes bacterium]|nr:hypothetical protein [Planctomycetota bacterium]